MDEHDPLRGFRQKFHYPKLRGLPSNLVGQKYRESDGECVYFGGHSLGLMPKSVQQYLQEILDSWAALGVYGHFYGPMPYAHCDEFCIEQSAKLVGALPDEVGVMNGLTVNEHLQMISFYQPTPDRYKVLIEDHAFPSDHYCMESQIRQRGYDPATSLICVKQRPGEYLLRTEDILDTIDKEGHNIAVIMLPGVQYYTGQVLDMKTITKAGHDKGCYVGFDLAHAVGNIELFMHDWDVDFACWCNYKYLNASAGTLGGMFIHERHAHNDMPRLLGWWGHQIQTRYHMTNVMELSPGAAGYRVNNPPPLLAATLKASLDIFTQATMPELRKKSKLLTTYMEYLLLTRHGQPADENTPATSSRPYLRIITPSDPEQRGSQLSIWFSVHVGVVFQELVHRGAVLDKREPDVLRLGLCPLYVSFQDCHRFVEILTEALHAAANGGSTTMPDLDFKGD